jgi:alpha-glucosidase (family GH31 glycosyl hydrolase)
MGCVWPGKVHYPDFNNPTSFDMWLEGLKNLSSVYNLSPSGFWIDMNEFSNFVNGEIPENGSCNNGENGIVVEGKNSFLEDKL